MLAQTWSYRWESHEARVQIWRGTNPWDRLYLDGTLSAEHRGWRLFPVTLAGKVAGTGSQVQEVRARIGWGARCRIWVDSVLCCSAVSHHWFSLRCLGHEIEGRYREWIFGRRLRLCIDGEIAAEKAVKGLPSKRGTAAEAQIQFRGSSRAQIVVRSGGLDGTTLCIDSEVIFQS
jgi:hypothetical protein